MVDTGDLQNLLPVPTPKEIISKDNYIDLHWGKIHLEKIRHQKDGSRWEWRNLGDWFLSRSLIQHLWTMGTEHYSLSLRWSYAPGTQ